MDRFARGLDNMVPAGALRGFGVPQAVWAYESQMDMIAERLGLDPVAFRRKNLLRMTIFSLPAKNLTACTMKSCWIVPQRR